MIYMSGEKPCPPLVQNKDKEFIENQTVDK